MVLYSISLVPSPEIRAELGRPELVAPMIASFDAFQTPLEASMLESLLALIQHEPGLIMPDLCGAVFHFQKHSLGALLRGCGAPHGQIDRIIGILSTDAQSTAQLCNTSWCIYTIDAESAWQSMSLSPRK